MSSSQRSLQARRYLISAYFFFKSSSRYAQKSGKFFYGTETTQFTEYVIQYQRSDSLHPYIFFRFFLNSYVFVVTLPIFIAVVFLGCYRHAKVVTERTLFFSCFGRGKTIECVDETFNHYCYNSMMLLNAVNNPFLKFELFFL